MDLLLEDTENMGEEDSDTLRNIRNLQISLKDKNWSQVQIKSYKKIMQKCKDQGEIYVGTKNSFDVHPNQKNTIGTNKALRTNMCKTTSQANIVENNTEKSAQMKYNIPVIVNGSITMNSDNVPLYMTGASENILNYDVQATDLLDDCECDNVLPRRELQRNNGNNNNMHMSFSCVNILPNLKDVKVDTSRMLNLKTIELTTDLNAKSRVNYIGSNCKHKYKILIIGDRQC
jgi:hypothetical protein